MAVIEQAGQAECLRPSLEVMSNLEDAKRVSRTSAAIENQAHYRGDGGLEPIDLIKAMGPKHFRAYCRGNIVKYAFRCEGKDRARDAEKIETYARWLRESFEEEASGA